jgi:L-histidine Nalpha-methyltransferase / hercynylcysteine S-oxide synthase
LKLNLTYYALDVDREELERSLRALNASYRSVKVAGFLGTYEDGMAKLKDIKKPKAILWLGSSAANMDREATAEFLRRFPMYPGDTWVIGLDRRKDSLKTWRAYNDSQGVTRAFELNALRNANKILGEEVFKEGEWDYVGEYDSVKGRHEASFAALKDVTVCGIEFKKGQQILIERSYKYGRQEVQQLWETAGVVEIGRWSDPEKAYGSQVRNFI